MAVCESADYLELGGGNVMRFCVKYWGRDVKGEESEINSDYRNSFMGAFYSFLPSILWARFHVRHK